MTTARNMIYYAEAGNNPVQFELATQMHKMSAMLSKSFKYAPPQPMTTTATSSANTDITIAHLASLLEQSEQGSESSLNTDSGNKETPAVAPVKDAVVNNDVACDDTDKEMTNGG